MQKEEGEGGGGREKSAKASPFFPSSLSPLDARYAGYWVNGDGYMCIVQMNPLFVFPRPSRNKNWGIEPV